MIDYRIVALGAAFPVLEGVAGGPSIGHSLLGAVGLLAVVMLATRGRRLLRRRLLGIPIGLLLHLVLDGTWTKQTLFLWPAFGSDFGSDQIPELARPLVIGVLLELLAIVAGAWAWRRYELGVAGNRARLVETGQLNREVLP